MQEKTSALRRIPVLLQSVFASNKLGLN